MILLINKIYLITAILFFAVSNVFADDAHSISATAPSKARVISPISLVNTDGQGLEFGVVAVGASNSTVVVSATETVIADVTGDAVVLTSTPQKAAKFTVSGEADKTYTITLPDNMSVLFGANSLTVDNFSCSNGTGGTIGTDDLFYVGAVLSVPSTAIPGLYQGSFSVTVAYMKYACFECLFISAESTGS